MAKIKQAFTPSQVALPTCGGCVLCGDLDDRHLYILGYDSKYYCKVCFFKMATRWPKPVPYKEPYKKKEWAENHDFFRMVLEEGNSFEDLVADMFRKAGLKVVVPARSVRRDADVKQALRGKWGDQVDMFVNGHRIEVKSKGYTAKRSMEADFTGPHDFAYPTVICSEVGKYEAMRVKPTAHVLISKKTGGIVVIPRSSYLSGAWVKETLPDRMRGTKDFYTCPRGSFTSYEELVEWLRAHPKGASNGQGGVQEVQGDDRVPGGSERGLPADDQGREAELDGDLRE